MSVAARNRLIREAGRLETLDQVQERLLPELARVTHASFVFAYRGLAHEQGIRAYLPASTPDFVADYFSEYAGECPLRRVKERVKGSVVATTALYGYRQLERTRVYNELWRPWGFDHHVAMRFDDPEGGAEVANLGVMINRDHRRGEYSGDELRFLRSLVPSLSGAVKRAARMEVLRDKVAALESIAGMDAGATPKIVLDADGRFVHAVVPPEAEGVVALLQEPKHPLRVAARRLVRGRADDELGPLELEHVIEVGSAGAEERWRASLALVERAPAGRPLVVVSLAQVRRVIPIDANAFGLTRSEAGVLEQLVAGQSNIEIGRRLFISPETVRTHLTRIYKKLGARSRLEAVLKARLRGSA